MNAILPATLNLNKFRPVGRFTFSFERKIGAVRLYVGECSITHLPFTIDDKSMTYLLAMMKREKTDVFFDGMHCYTTGKNSLVMIKHPLISEWIKNNT
jgi:hypothetical protein